MNIFFNTFYFCSFFFKGVGIRAGLWAGPKIRPAARPAQKRALARRAGPKVGRGLFGDLWSTEPRLQIFHTLLCIFPFFQPFQPWETSSYLYQRLLQSYLYLNLNSNSNLLVLAVMKLFSCSHPFPIDVYQDFSKQYGNFKKIILKLLQ